MYPRPRRGPAASIKTFAPGTGSPCVLTTRPTRSGPNGENAGVLGGNAESGARAKAGGLDACAVLEPRVGRFRPRSTPPSTTAASKQTGTSHPRRGLASSLMGQSVSNMTMAEKVQLSFRASSKSFNRPLLSLFLIRSVRLMIFTGMPSRVASTFCR